MAVTVELTNGYELQKLFEDYGRGNSFSNEAYDALFDYLDQFSDDSGEDVHVDVIGLCCDFDEYDNLKELYDAYSYSYDSDEPEFESIDKDDFFEWINDRTLVIELSNGGYLIESF